jgi:phage tail sheath protein FI
VSFVLFTFVQEHTKRNIEQTVTYTATFIEDDLEAGKLLVLDTTVEETVIATIEETIDSLEIVSVQYLSKGV